MKKKARKSPEFLKKAIIYQIFLRAFTSEGTLKSAEKRLPHLAETGVNLLYLCPVVLADDDPRMEFWSDRQKKCGLNNPRNPYRIKDYYTIDPEYGTADDLKDFVRSAHSLGMRVLLDLVYYHCGPSVVFIDTNPDFVKRDENGAVKNGPWHFPELNFESKGLREYLWKNMEYFLREFDVDGYRCDVGPAVPLDFWEEGRRRMEAVKSDSLLLCEGDKPEDQEFAFDLNYGWMWTGTMHQILAGEVPASELKRALEKAKIKFPEGARFLRMFDNHDHANDCGKERYVTRFGQPATDLALILAFMADGVPFLYNGEEIADDAQHSIYSNAAHGRLTIRWDKGFTPEGRERLALIRRLCKLRRELPALHEGTLEWLDSDCPEQIVAFRRSTGSQTVTVAANLSARPCSVSANAFSNSSDELLLENGTKILRENGKVKLGFSPFGYRISKG